MGPQTERPAFQRDGREPTAVTCEGLPASGGRRPRGARSHRFSAFPSSCHEGALSGPDARKSPCLASLALAVMGLLCTEADFLLRDDVV